MAELVAAEPPVDFSEALRRCKGGGERIARLNWNGPGMYVVYQAGYPQGIGINANTARATGIAEGAVCVFREYLMMFTADGEFVPWVASQSDILSDDWVVV